MRSCFGTIWEEERYSGPSPPHPPKHATKSIAYSWKRFSKLVFIKNALLISSWTLASVGRSGRVRPHWWRSSGTPSRWPWPVRPVGSMRTGTPPVVPWTRRPSRTTPAPGPRLSSDVWDRLFGRCDWMPSWDCLPCSWVRLNGSRTILSCRKSGRRRGSTTFHIRSICFSLIFFSKIFFNWFVAFVCYWLPIGI